VNRPVRVRDGMIPSTVVAAGIVETPEVADPRAARFETLPAGNRLPPF
jgi:hypothetical protein